MPNVARIAVPWMVLILTLGSSAYAQSGSYQFERLTPQEGLSERRTTAIVQDSLGFLWIGTHNGLNRYDGYGFKVYYHEPGDSTSLGSNYVEDLLWDSRNRLWIGNLQDGGVHRYDPAQDAFERFPHRAGDSNTPCSDNVLHMAETRDGTVWIGHGDGLTSYDPTQGEFTCHPCDDSDPKDLPCGSIYSISEDLEGALWVALSRADGTILPSSGLCRIQREQWEVECFRHDPADPGSLRHSGAMSTLLDSRGTFWVGTFGDGLHHMGDRPGVFVHHPYRPNRPASLSGPYRPETRSGSVTVIQEDSRGTLWFGGMGGLVVYDPIEERVTRLSADPQNTDTAPLEYVSRMAEDRSGAIWISGGFGVTKITTTERGFQRFGAHPRVAEELTGQALNAVFEDSKGIVWLGTNEGLKRWDRSAGTLEAVVPDRSGAPSSCFSNVNLIAETRSGDLYFGGAGFGRINRDTNKLTCLHLADSPALFQYVWALLENREGLILLSTGDGTRVWSPERGTLEPFQGPWGALSLHEDTSGDVWFGVWSTGLYRLRHGAREVEWVLEGASINAIHEDRNEMLWLATQTLGLVRLDPKTGEWKSVSEEAGFSRLAFWSILEDDSGALWSGTSSGLVRYDPKSGILREYDASDGVRNRSFTPGAARGGDGTLFFAGELGLTAFRPEAFSVDPTPPTVVLTGYSAVDRSGRQVIAGPLLAGRRVVLDYRSANVTFDYVGLHFLNPKRNVYRYRLEPYESDWVDAGTARSARYTNLAPGAYTFRVTAANADGVWSEEGTFVEVTILPPWWRTGWAFLGYGLILMGALAGAFRWQRYRIEQRELERARLRELEQAREIEKAYTDLEVSHRDLKAAQQQLIQSEKMASLGQLTAGIAHEIQNPLNFVNNFALLSGEIAGELAAEASENAERPLGGYRDDLVGLKANVDRIARHGKRAEEIVKGMMAHAQTSSGERFEVGLNHFVEEYVGIAYSGLRARIPDLEVEIRTELAPDVGTVRMAPQEVGRALVNLLNNAFEAVHRRRQADGRDYKPVVTVSTIRQEKCVEIRITDNGPGIPDEIRERIFEPFFTTKPAGAGTGLGLSLAYEIIVDGHGGTLRAESEAGNGATFIVTLPALR